MPESKIIPAPTSGVTKPTTTTGDVYLEHIIHDEHATIANVTFAPCARTHWHTHVGGQMISVLSGTGWVCDKGGEARRIKAGDTVWAPPGTTHWHGADDGSIMSHLIVGVGETNWLDAVTEEEYKKRSTE
ncbi:cupin domain-containing protein [Colletotrichum eremochloae]|nr:cupin domain-containing protein [Colletotrichum eremochloae]